MRWLALLLAASIIQGCELQAAAPECEPFRLGAEPEPESWSDRAYDCDDLPGYCGLSLTSELSEHDLAKAVDIVFLAQRAHDALPAATDLVGRQPHTARALLR